MGVVANVQVLEPTHGVGQIRDEPIVVVDGPVEHVPRLLGGIEDHRLASGWRPVLETVPREVRTVRDHLCAEPQGEQPARVVLQGTTLALHVAATDPTSQLVIPVTALTEEGVLLIEMLDRPTSLKGICEGAKRLAQTDFDVRIGATLEPRGGAGAGVESVHDITSLCLRD